MRKVRQAERCGLAVKQVTEYSNGVQKWIEQGCQLPDWLSLTRCFSVHFTTNGLKGAHLSVKDHLPNAVAAARELYMGIVNSTPQLLSAAANPDFPHWYKFWTWKDRPCRTYGVPRGNQIMIYDSLFKYRYVPMNQLKEVESYNTDYFNKVQWTDNTHFDVIMEPTGFVQLMLNDFEGLVYAGINYPYV